VPAIAALAVASWFWGWLPFHTAPGLNPLTWPPAFFSWFAAGMLLAEWIYSPIGWPHRLARHRLPMAVVVLAAYLVAASPLAGPAGLVPSSAAQFTIKTAMGALVAAGLVAPLVLDRPDAAHRLLGSAPMVTLGRWSYGIFIWHLAALTMVFPVIGQFAFHGHMPEVLAFTLIFSIAIAAVSYALVESPSREALRRWELRKSPRPQESAAVSPRQEDAVAP
jgi:peptidoglycan/LPS O-acetylase OafA/YrhL